MIDSHYVAPLSMPVATDVSLFGAKTANLAKAIQMGFKVPEGIAVSKRCPIDRFSAFAQDIIDTTGVPVAVRSSAVNEDSSAMAFAGMFETCLGIRSAADLVEAFEFVKNSGASERIRKYQGGVVPADDVAVLVQRMVDATRAGVAFSRDPSTGEKKVIIESNYGLGKSVVDGEVTPDSIEYSSDGTSTTIIGRKSMQISLSDSGIQERPTPEEDSQKSSLSEEEIAAIAELAQRVETELKFAADIEWAIDASGDLWLLQARPITTVSPELGGDSE